MTRRRTRRGLVRAIIPDSHGDKIDYPAMNACLGDLARLCPDQVIFLGDHVDASGIWDAHAPSALEDKEYSYYEDISEANDFLDKVQKACPKASFDYLEGNHEYHVERWACENLSERDAKKFVGDMGPHAKLQLKKRGFKFFRQMECYEGLSIPNTIKRGHCYFTHGHSAAKFATSVHLDNFGASIVHGHTHRAQSIIKRTVVSGAIGAWCPGTLAKLQPTYQHTRPSGWTHGYALQFENPSGLFQHVNVTIVKGKSLLQPLLERLG